MIHVDMVYVFQLKAKLRCDVKESLLHVLLHVVLKLLLDIGGGVLVLLVLGHEVVHVGLGLGKLHLVHALACVPVEESLSSEHGSELLGDSLEDFLDGGGVADEGGSHLQTSWWDVADSSLDVVGNPLHEVAAVLVLD